MRRMKWMASALLAAGILCVKPVLAENRGAFVAGAWHGYYLSQKSNSVGTMKYDLTVPKDGKVAGTAVSDDSKAVVVQGDTLGYALNLSSADPAFSEAGALLPYWDGSAFYTAQYKFAGEGGDKGTCVMLKTINWGANKGPALATDLLKGQYIGGGLGTATAKFHDQNGSAFKCDLTTNGTTFAAEGTVDCAPFNNGYSLAIVGAAATGAHNFIRINAFYYPATTKAPAFWNGRFQMISPKGDVLYMGNIRLGSTGW